MGVITELTFRLASNERDPVKPFGAQLRRHAPSLLSGVSLVVGRAIAACMHTVMVLALASKRTHLRPYGYTGRLFRCHLHQQTMAD